MSIDGTPTRRIDVSTNRLFLPLLFALPGIALAVFGPAVRVDQETRPGYACYHADIAIGPELGGTQPVYVAFENDSVPFTIERSDIAFQRSTDQGQTWLPADVIIRRGSRFACYPDMQVARDGTIHLLYTDRIDGSKGHIHAVRSTDFGSTWTTPVQVDDNSSRVAIGWAKLALDSADNLFCTWTDQRGSYLRVYSDVSTDGGATWGTDVRVDDDTVSFNCYPPDCFIQPGTNDFLVTAVAPVRGPSGIVLHSHFYRSTDMGSTFSPGFQLDTFSGYSQQPHVVADSSHVITDYSGNGYGNQCVTMARTMFTPPDTWGPQVNVQEFDTIYSSFTNGAKLAIDRQGTVHIGLMFSERQTMLWNTFYAFSTDHGLTWSEREEVGNLPTTAQWDPTIAVDGDGRAYLAWQDMRNTKAEIWFSTNAMVGVEEPGPASPAARISLACEPNPCRGATTIRLSPVALRHSPLTLRVYDAQGRLVLSRPVSTSSLPLSTSDLSSGTYFITLNAGNRRATARLVVQR
jgi:hypothetical protein